MNGYATSLDITGLIKWTCYEVQVRAVTIKNGIYSGSVKQRTSEDGKMINLFTHKAQQHCYQVWPRISAYFLEAHFQTLK